MHSQPALLPPNPLADLTRPQRDRLAFLELRARFIGEIGRQDLVARFGIQTAAASRDLALYRAIAPGNSEYDTKARTYIGAEAYKPIFDFPPERVLSWLAQGYADGEPIRLKGPLPHEGSRLPYRLDLDLLAVLSRAIHQGKPIEVTYRSLTSGLTTREIIPFALGDSGLRWHVRAFDRRSGSFRDFALGRFEAARLTHGGAAEHESADRDIQWNRIAELELVPHPANVQHPDTIAAEYGMESGVLKIQLRAAMAGYLLRRWNVDCTEDHCLTGSEYQLWLRNRLALYGVTNLVLAPGYGAEATED